MVSTSDLKFGIIGCGLIGTKRAMCLPKGSLSICIDTKQSTARDMLHKSDHLGAHIARDLTSENVDMADVWFVCTPHKYLYEYSRTLIVAGKHVMIEKPGAISSVELEDMEKIAKAKRELTVRVGYNHRFHDAFLCILKGINTNFIGNIMSINAYYGHGGAWINKKDDWRLEKRLNGGGDFIDKGSHLVDLIQWILIDDLSVEFSSLKTRFSDASVEDNSIVVMKGIRKGADVVVQTSCTDWKNTFRFEIHGKKGKILIQGLGGSYGTEKVTLYGMKEGKIKPEISSLKWLEDNSFQKETDEFIRDIGFGFGDSIAGRLDLSNAKKTMKIIEEVYQRNNQ